jgi:hypothetical protein
VCIIISFSVSVLSSNTRIFYSLSNFVDIHTGLVFLIKQLKLIPSNRVLLVEVVKKYFANTKAVLDVRRLDVDFSPQRLRFSSVRLQVRAVFEVSPLFHTHLSPPHEVRHIRHRAPQYHSLSPMLGASSLTRH